MERCLHEKYHRQPALGHICCHEHNVCCCYNGETVTKEHKQEGAATSNKGRAMASYTAPAASPVAGARNGNDAGKEPGRTCRSSDHLCLRDITRQKFQDVTALHLKQHEYP